MPDVTFNIDVYCATCGAPMCSDTDVHESRGGVSFHVHACERCMDNARDEGYEDGVQAGLKEGERD